MQLVFDMERLPEHLRMLEERAKEELRTPCMKTAGFGTMKKFTTERLKEALR
jgi:hypothetical protein